MTEEELFRHGSDNQLLPYTEANVTIGNEWYRIRHYPNNVWEILDSDGFSIAHGRGYQT